MLFYCAQTNRLAVGYKGTLVFNMPDSFFLKKATIKPIGTIRTLEKTLYKECKALLKDIPVRIGRYPIFLEEKQPNYDFFAEFHSKFISYNDEKKIKEQNKLSRGLCSIRAEYFNLLMRRMGVTTYKVFKTWRLFDWRKLKPNAESVWVYHCAVMLISNDGQKFVFDQWKTPSNQLLTLKEWATWSKHPKPRKILIANSTVISDHKDGESSSEALLEELPITFFNSLQAVCISATPNHPERPIHLDIQYKHYSNSKERERNKITVHQGLRSSPERTPNNFLFSHQTAVSSFNEPVNELTTEYQSNRKSTRSNYSFLKRDTSMHKTEKINTPKHCCVLV
jgi:hypothetical protein